MLSGGFGRYVLAAGAVGVAALLLTALPRVIGDARLRAIIRQGQRATARPTLRWSIVLLLVLLVAAEQFGLDVVLGAVLAVDGAAQLDPQDGRGRRPAGGKARRRGLRLLHSRVLRGNGDEP
jgi:hypothetical protein